MILGIIGGMGPAATLDLYGKIIEFTHASRDQDHIHVVIDSNVRIPDRTQYICGTGEDPRIEMIRSAVRLEMMGADYIAMPCNTAHYFYDDIVRHTRAKVLNMIGETAAFLTKSSPGIRDFVLLATEGTYAAGVYAKVFKDYGLNIIEPGETDKKTVMDWIYGVKSGRFEVSTSEFEALANRYLVHRNMSLILGCTELPLLAEKINCAVAYVNPASILAKRCVEIAENDKKNRCEDNG